MLKVKFWRIENVVLMKVLEQGDEIKRYGGIFYTDKSTNINLISCTQPAININQIYVNGINSNADQQVVSCDFKNIDIAKNFYNRAVQTIKNYNNSIGFTEMPKDIEVESTIAE